MDEEAIKYKKKYIGPGDEENNYNGIYLRFLEILEPMNYDDGDL